MDVVVGDVIESALLSFGIMLYDLFFSCFFVQRVINNANGGM